jgi:hypothetical protein
MVPEALNGKKFDIIVGFRQRKLKWEKIYVWEKTVEYIQSNMR